jgi:non-ribosomal peptide synthetase component E (peptide arylation enzyme)
MEEYSRLVAEHDRLLSHAEAGAKNDRLAAKLRELGIDPDCL